MNFIWKILELINENGKITVRYHLTAIEDQNSVDTEGYHTFSEGCLDIPLEEAKESNFLAWLEKDTTKDDVNAIKLNLENQLNELKKDKKVGFPWLVNTFKVQI